MTHPAASVDFANGINDAGMHPGTLITGPGKAANGL